MDHWSDRVISPGQCVGCTRRPTGCAHNPVVNGTITQLSVGADQVAAGKNLDNDWRTARAEKPMEITVVGPSPVSAASWLKAGVMTIRRGSAQGRIVMPRLENGLGEPSYPSGATLAELALLRSEPPATLECNSSSSRHLVRSVSAPTTRHTCPVQPSRATESV